MVIIAIFFVLGIMVQYVTTNTSFFSDSQDKKLMTLNISGGLAAMQIDVEYYSDGLIVYNNSKTHFGRSIQIQQPMLEELTSRIAVLIRDYKQGLVLNAEPGSADYFTYSLAVFNNGKALIYQWTDTSKSPPSLHGLASLISQVNNLASKDDSIIFFIKIDKTNYKEGEKLLFRVIALNPTGENYNYQSPTPCTPNFNVIIVGPDIKGVEVYPIGSEADKPCTQVVQGRVLGSDSQIQSEYEYTFKAQGSYIIQTSFPYPEWSDSRYQDEVVISYT